MVRPYTEQLPALLTSYYKLQDVSKWYCTIPGHSDTEHTSWIRRPPAKKVAPPSRKSVVSAVGTPRDTPEGTPQPGTVGFHSLFFDRLTHSRHRADPLLETDTVGRDQPVRMGPKPSPFQEPGLRGDQGQTFPEQEDGQTDPGHGTDPGDEPPG